MSNDDHARSTSCAAARRSPKDRARRLSDRARQLGSELPGDTGPELGKKLGSAIDSDGTADSASRSGILRRACRDPRRRRLSLAKARDRARSAARQAQEARSATSRSGSRAPTSTAPRAVPRDLLEAMKKKGAVAPEATTTNQALLRGADQSERAAPHGHDRRPRARRLARRRAPRIAPSPRRHQAARYLQTARLDDARAVLADLQKRVPDTQEVKWLEAELAFQSGDYAGALKQLDKVPADAVEGLVGQTRKLAASNPVGDRVVHRGPLATRPLRDPLCPGPRRDDRGLAGEVLDSAWETVGEDLGLRPADPIRVELLGAPVDLAKLSR